MIEMIIEQAGNGKSEGEREPHTNEASVNADTENVSQGQRHDKIGEEGHEHCRTNIGQSAHGIAESALQTVAELIDD